MKLYWVSNSPHAQSGYGVQTDLFTRMAVKAGWDVVVRCFYGHRGGMIRDGGRLLLPGSYHEAGEDVLMSDILDHRPDASVILYDAWVYDPELIARVPVSLYAPVDHDPITDGVLARLKRARHVLAMSRHGERQMRRNGVDPYYFPHATDTAIYRPISRAEAREALKISPDTFLAVTVAANKGYPDRKNLRGLMQAWAQFAPDKDALLWMHSNPLPVNSGLDLERVRDFWGLSPRKVRFAEPYHLLNGFYSGAWMNALYNAADVFVLPSCGEGFGVPILDAQAAGCPVIVSDFTAMTELCGAGWLLPIDSLNDVEYTPYGSLQARPQVRSIVEALNMAYEARGDAEVRADAVEFAQQYAIETVWAKYAMPALLEIAETDAHLMGGGA